VTEARAYEISLARLQEWATELATIPATPAVVIAIGHGTASGQIHLFAPEQFRDSEISNLLQIALKLIHQGALQRL
jgi:hypothetical protein